MESKEEQESPRRTKVREDKTQRETQRAIEKERKR